MPVEVFHHPIQGTLVYVVVTDGSVCSYRFVRAGLTRIGRKLAREWKRTAVLAEVEARTRPVARRLLSLEG